MVPVQLSEPETVVDRAAIHTYLLLIKYVKSPMLSSDLGCEELVAFNTTPFEEDQCRRIRFGLLTRWPRRSNKTPMLLSSHQK